MVRPHLLTWVDLGAGHRGGRLSSDPEDHQDRPSWGRREDRSSSDREDRRRPSWAARPPSDPRTTGTALLGAAGRTALPRTGRTTGAALLGTAGRTALLWTGRAAWTAFFGPPGGPLFFGPGGPPGPPFLGPPGGPLFFGPGAAFLGHPRAALLWAGGRACRGREDHRIERAFRWRPLDFLRHPQTQHPVRAFRVAFFDQPAADFAGEEFLIAVGCLTEFFSDAVL